MYCSGLGKQLGLSGGGWARLSCQLVVNTKQGEENFICSEHVDYPRSSFVRSDSVRSKRFQQQVNSGLVGLTRPRYFSETT